MKLHLGFMHRRELAAFFHRKESSFTRHKAVFEKYCTILEDYAVFKIVRGGVEILEILDDSEYDEIVFDLDRGIREAMALAPHSRYVKNGIILTSSSILDHILKTQATEKQQERFIVDKKLVERFQHRISYRLRKIGLLEDESLNNYWSSLINNEQIELPVGRMIVPLIKDKYDYCLTAYQELTQEDKELLERLIAEEEANDSENTKLAAYHLLDTVECYQGREKEFYAEAKKLCKPFYRAMKRFNNIRNKIYVSKGTLCVEERS